MLWKLQKFTGLGAMPLHQPFPEEKAGTEYFKPNDYFHDFKAEDPGSSVSKGNWGAKHEFQ